VRSGQSLTRVLADPRLTAQTSQDRALTQEMVYGSLRTLPRLEALVHRLLAHPLKAGDRDLEALILVGLYQLLSMDTPEHAAVAATVEASRLLGKPGKAGLVNAVLRRFLRERGSLLAQIENAPGARWLLPDWLLERLRAAWPQDWESIVEASNGRAPMSLRVNAMQIDRDGYLTQLTAAGITARPIPGCAMGLTLDRPVPTRDLPGFAAGLVSVQDGGAQIAAPLLDARPGQRVLDACAAPGGKTAAILERARDRLDLTAVDQAPERLAPLRDNLARLGLHATLIQDDASGPRHDWATHPFDRILLDVPCSATGVIRRHPDIKWLRRESDIPALCALQDQILEATWPLLASAGRLLYVTCSLLPEENQDRIAAFLSRHTDARLEPIDPPGARPCTAGCQLLPTPGAHDGFYFAALVKRAP
jgi:16S rRNA (cytosine967-C5)-methyltransferase